MVSTLAGSENPGFRDGKSEEAQFSAPMGIAIDSRGIIVIAGNYPNSRNSRIFR
jgi:hypothetical protein